MKRLLRKIRIRAIIRGIKNIIRWSPIIWNDRDFDYQYLLIIMNKKLSQMEKYFLSDKTLSRGANKHGKKIKTARILTDRLIQEDYSGKKFNDKYDSRSVKHSRYLQEQDLNYLMNMLNKNMFCWWD